MTKKFSDGEDKPETVMMWGAFWKGYYPNDKSLLGVFKLKKDAVKAAKNQNAGSADGFWPRHHFDGIVEEVECVVVGNMAFPIHHGIPIEPEVETPKHDCLYCKQDLAQAAKRKAQREARKKAKARPRTNAAA